MTSIDELLRSVMPAREADAIETADLAAIRAALYEQIAGGEGAGASGSRRRWSGAGVLRWVPAVVACVVALVIGAVAVTAVRHRHSPPVQSLSGPAAGRGANALIAKLAVLRRPQSSSDRLPSNLPALLREGDRGREGFGVIIPSLSRLVASRPGTRLYLVVTTPIAGQQSQWSPSLGDQVTIVAITAHGATEPPGYPAVALSDPTLLIPVGDTFSQDAKPTRQAVARTNAYDVAIVPDGVARVRWTFANRAGSPGPTIAAAVSNNVAITRVTRGELLGALLRAIRYTADGTVIPTNTTALTRVLAHRTAVERRDAIRQIERQNATVPASVLAPFAVFSFNGPRGTRTRDGYVISHPPLTALPLSLLTLGRSPRQSFDVRQIRHVIAPSGLAMWVIPGSTGICFSITGIKLAYGRASLGDYSCSGDYQQADSEGTGESTSGSSISGSVVFGVIPRKLHTVSIPTGTHTHRTIHPAAGVYIARTPFQIG